MALSLMLAESLNEALYPRRHLRSLSVVHSDGGCRVCAAGALSGFWLGMDGRTAFGRVASRLPHAPEQAARQ